MKAVFRFCLTLAVLASPSLANAASDKPEDCNARLENLRKPVDKENLKSRIGGAFEPITSTQTGAQVYSIVTGAHPDKYTPGFYKRSQGGWDLLIPGKVLADERGAPFVVQLELSKTDNKSYTLTVMDGKIYIITSFSDPSKPDTIMPLGSPESPLYEIGSMQKRTLGPIAKGSEISVYQDDTLTEKGSQLVLVSVKLVPAQAVGEGLTFAFEIMPNTDGSKVTLNGKPIVIDYDFQNTKQLSELVGGSEQKIIYSRILVDHFQNSNLTSFGKHLNQVKDLIGKYVYDLSSSGTKGSDLESEEQKVAFNSTAQEIYKNVSFTKRFIIKNSRTKLEQEYFPGLSRSKLKITHNSTDYEIDGALDLLPDGMPAAWESAMGGLILSVDNSLYAFYGLEVKLGDTKEILGANAESGGIPEQLSSYISLSSADKDVENGLIILGVKRKDGTEDTYAIKLNMLGKKILKVEGEPYRLLEYYIGENEIAKRIHADATGDVIFDTLTPKVESIAAYEQASDESAPYLNVYASMATGTKYKFKKPNKILEFDKTLNYATFASRPEVEDPSGLYFNIEKKKITGNEETKIVGELLVNPLRYSGEERDVGEADYIFANTVVGIKGKDQIRDDENEEDVKTNQKLFLFATDASRNGGKKGFQFNLAVSNVEGEYTTFQIGNLPRPWLNNISSFKEAIFINGRKGQKRFVTLLIAFKDPSPGGAEATFSFGINLNKPLEETLSPIQVDASAITARILDERLGYDEDGNVFINVTPDLSEDSHGYAVFDLKSGRRIFPNQSMGEKRKITFGEYKKNTSYEATYVRGEDSWVVSGRGEIEKIYPDLGKSAELAEFDSFVELSKQLDQMANSRTEPKRMILIVPATLREMVWDFVLKKGFTGEQLLPGLPGSRVDTFSYSNRNLQVNLFSQNKASQEQYLANLQSWAKARKLRPEERSFFLARLDDIQKSNRGMPAPRDPTQGFTVRDVNAVATNDITNVPSGSNVKYPDALYLLAAEHPMQFKEFKHEKHPASASMFILATPEEMAIVKGNATSEIENGLLNQYEIHEIKDPDLVSMAVSMSNIFNNPDVKSLEYSFSAKEIRKTKNALTTQENFDTVIDYAVSRFTYLVDQKKESKFESFMRFRSAFAMAILADKEVRRTRIINKYFVERVLTQVFDIPMNLATLPDDDPLKILSRQDALLLLQEAGYSGPFDLKAKVLDTLLSQARADAGKPVPSSVILFGNTGSGKTFMFRSLVKMLHLKLYDFGTSSNTDASAIIVNMGHIVEGEGASSKEGSMSIGQVIAHLEYFLAQPNGYRGYILIDDVHSANDKVKARMLSWLRGMFESQDGMYTVKVNNKFVRRPVRNLNIFMTLNPTADQEQISKYAKDKSKPTTEEILLATLSTSDFKVEPSFLMRFGRIINLDYMPAGAKGPELIKSIARSSNDLLNTHNRIALVDPKLIQMLVKDNERVDARSFLSASTSSLIEMAASDPKAGSLVLVVPKSTGNRGGKDNGFANETSSTEKISKWVSKNTRTLSLDSGLDGNLAFIEMIADAFRIPIYESLVMALQEDRRLAGDTVNQKTLLGPILAAVQDHLSNRGYVTVNDLNLNASEFGMKTASERDYFRSALDRSQDGPKPPPFYPDFFKSIDSQISTWQDVQSTSHPENVFNQKAILSETIQQNHRLLRQRLSETLRVTDAEMLPTPEKWLANLQANTVTDPKAVGHGLVDVLWNYFPQMFDKRIEDDLSDKPSLAIYGATRLYLYAVDRAIVQLPWVSTSKFLLKALEAITEDQVLSQKPGVQRFLFTDPQRLIKPSITDLTFQIIASSHAFEELSAGSRERMREEFKKRYETPEKPINPKEDN